MNGEIVTYENLRFGELVVRGPAWSFDDQDTCKGGDGFGVMLGYENGDCRSEWIEVEWSGGYSNVYPLSIPSLRYATGPRAEKARLSAEERRRKEDERYARLPL